VKPTSLEIDGLLFDLDGTITQGDEAIPGAAEALARLRSAGVPFLFVTNTTRRPRSQVVEKLQGVGVEASNEECLTAPMAAASWLKTRGATTISLLLNPDTFVEFQAFEIDDEQPEYVVLGDLGDNLSYSILDRAFRAIMSGAELVAIQRNRYWKKGDKLSLDAGPFVAALEYATGKKAHLVGKPSPDFFFAATTRLDLSPRVVAMVGDDVESDIAGAREAGLRAVAVRTGKFRPADEQRGREVANAVLDSIQDLPRWLGLEA
jgi:phospholysine phosphohistidine inorganic pyrophosphate phosphatase